MFLVRERPLVALLRQAVLLLQVVPLQVAPHRQAVLHQEVDLRVGHRELGPRPGVEKLSAEFLVE